MHNTILVKKGDPMTYNKMFFPIGGGDELQERIHGALLIGKYFQAHLEILKAKSNPSQIMNIDQSLSPVILKQLNKMVKDDIKSDVLMHTTIVEEEAKKLGITISKKRIKGIPTAEMITARGYRSQLIEQESKYCDVVVVASPPKGKITATFETTITQSGKPALMFPRKMKSFSTKKIIIGWNNSPEVARAVSQAIPLMQKAKKVHIITSKEYTNDIVQITKLQAYLACHDIETTYEVVKTTMIPGEALLSHAKKGNYDLIVAGAFGHKGFKELMLGGTTQHLLKHTNIPVFMSH